MKQASHHRAFAVTVAWTLVLLFLGSVVHATESSLACPDWPTCFGSMVPEMEGGVFWEHLHRLVAGGLLLLFGLAAWLAYRQAEQSWIFPASLAGLGLLLVQSVFGGLTVLFELPDAVSTTHLALALLFLALAAVLAGATSPKRRERPEPSPDVRAFLAAPGTAIAGLVFVQSVLGGAVRHMDAGMACGTGILCNGSLVPAAWSPLTTLHWLHRLLGVLIASAVVWAALSLTRKRAPRHVLVGVWTVVALVALQIALGFLSTSTVLAVTPVSLHTLVAAALVAVCTLLAAWGYIETAPAGAGTGDGEPNRAASPVG